MKNVQNLIGAEIRPIGHCALESFMAHLGLSVSHLSNRYSSLCMFICSLNKYLSVDCIPGYVQGIRMQQ